MSERNVLGGELQLCGDDPVTGIYRDGTCAVGPDGVATHTICVVVTEAFLAHQRAVGNDLLTPRPELRFPGLHPGEPGGVVAGGLRQGDEAGAAALVVLAATHQRALDVVPVAWLREHAVDVPDDLGGL